MRDTSHLRSRIAVLACLPALAISAACSDPPTKATRGRRPPQTDEDRTRSKALNAAGGRRELAVSAERVAYYQDKAKKEGKTLQEVMPAEQYAAYNRMSPRDQRKLAAHHQAANAVVPPPAMNPQHQPIAGDPPFIDGYNPEEEHCESGNWCGTIEAASPIAVPKVEERMGCSSKIAGGKGSEQIKADGKTYAGLSSAPNMQGALNDHGTELARAKTGNDQMCCYHWFEYCSGRPLLDGGSARTAELVDGSGWQRGDESGDPIELPADVRASIAEQWQQDALAEHASVAAFARTTLELMAVGAPPQLLADAQRAGLDEIDHAQRCFALAVRYGATPRQPGPLPAVAPRTATLAQLAADTFAEGCVGETIAALSAQRAARDCIASDVADDLHQIADDESRHAALAWATIAWAIEHGGAKVARAVIAAANELRAAVPPRGKSRRHPQHALLAAHGRLDAHAQRAAAHDAWDEIIDPMLASLLDRSASPQRPVPAESTDPML